jgi:lysyl-tRNA synthetase class 2
MEKSSDIIENRREKLEALRRQKISLYPNDVAVSHAIGEIRELIDENPEGLTGQGPVFQTAGRLMAGTGPDNFRPTCRKTGWATRGTLC